MKINTIFLLTAIGVFATFSLLTMSTTTNFNAAAQSNETENNPNFYANFTAPPGSNSEATGNATFTVGDDPNTMLYVISGNGLGNISQVVILQSTGGRTTDLVQPLYYAPTSGLYTKGSGTADGNFTSDNFVNILKGKPMTELVKKIIDGEVYLAIKTVDFPLGEIAGKITPVK
ncbi:MAG TPA: CHRD domain-containing protein [Candidatus Nitrosocosmicus sp.]|jgi:CHRD domain-containing protein|uniref:CHRD domain protein n=1 Tax=Candidatus Nitrosocosmicus oleophilus TaxID=1353260 RepID=A0A654LWP1_9ARCH|nr:CHRD domain-containing protein [Candidatus Nitrosocosmicus oleophilus]ALI34743.1 CHRD domain protein [Candidatus Nitrosocosmicus oleophilus]HKU84514.1 CHRD domain-containing protein [Candidatus Nitrosocosmicus sp.]